jgi:hypothetical protein
MRALLITFAMVILTTSPASSDGCISVKGSSIVNECDTCQQVKIRERRPINNGGAMADTTATVRSVVIQAGHEEKLATDARSVVIDARDCQ